MPILTASVARAGEIIIAVGVEVYHPRRPETNRRACGALVNTGALRSFISPLIVSWLGVPQHTVTEYVGVDGTVQHAPAHMVGFEFSNSTPTTGPSAGNTHRLLVEALVLPDNPSSHNVMLGMDVLRLLHVSMCKGEFSASI